MSQLHTGKDAVVQSSSRSGRARHLTIALVAGLTAMMFTLSSAPFSHADEPDAPEPELVTVTTPLPEEEPPAPPESEPAEPPELADAPDLSTNIDLMASAKAIVTFDPNGGKVTKPEKTVTIKGKYGKLPKPTRTGYKFKGWYTALANGKKVTSDTKVPNELEITLYAKWTAKKYQVKFKPGKGTVSKESKKVKFGSTYGSLPKPKRYGYNFAGWFTKAGDKITSDTQMLKASKHTLYARWAGKVHQVKFSPRNGAVEPTVLNVQYGAKYGELPKADRANYDFTGWYTKASGGKKITANSKVKTTKAETLYGHWTGKKSTVTFKPNGGSVAKKSKTVTYGNKFGKLPVPTRNNFQFAGWYTEAEGGKHIVAGTSVTFTTGITLYAHWKKRPNHWVDVNLTKLTLKMMDGDTVVATFPISPGKPSTPTPKGTYYVYAKTANQSMGGYKNVKWSTWWRSNYAIHTAYWHNEFGKKAVSHGCINMREADAKRIYNWMYIGSKVWVHG